MEERHMHLFRGNFLVTTKLIVRNALKFAMCTPFFSQAGKQGFKHIFECPPPPLLKNHNEIGTYASLLQSPSIYRMYVYVL